MNRTIIAAFALTFILIAGCTKDSPGNGTASVTQDIPNQVAIDETSRLASLIGQQTATPADFNNLAAMLSDNEHALDELGEIVTLVKYGEYEHVSHAIAFFDGYLRTGSELLCPAHALSHYYVFKKHGEDDLAEEALEEAEEQMPEWIPKAREYDQKYPSGQNFEEVVRRISADIENIESGNTTASDDEISFLTDEASICVEA